MFDSGLEFLNAPRHKQTKLQKTVYLTYQRIQNMKTKKDIINLEKEWASRLKPLDKRLELLDRWLKEKWSQWICNNNYIINITKIKDIQN